MMQYIYVNQNGIKLIKQNGIIPIDDLKNKIGIPDVDSPIKMIYSQFSHRRTVIVCDAGAVQKDLPILGITRSGYGVRGSFIIANVIKDDVDCSVTGMGQERTEIALREIKLVRQ